MYGRIACICIKEILQTILTPRHTYTFKLHFLVYFLCSVKLISDITSDDKNVTQIFNKFCITVL